MVQSPTVLTLQDFLNLPEGDRPLELIEGQAVPKMSPKSFHAAVQAALIILLQSWSQGKGRFYPEWAIQLKRIDTLAVNLAGLTGDSCFLGCQLAQTD